MGRLATGSYGPGDMIWARRHDMQEKTMTHLERRGWVPGACEDYIQRIAAD